MVEVSKEKLLMNYNLATMIALFVNNTMSGKEIPSINELYPAIYGEEKKPEEDDDYKAMMLYKEQMIDYANEYNLMRRDKKK